MRSAVHVATVAEGDDDNEEHVVLDGVDDPVIADSHSVTDSTFQRSRGGRSGVLRQQCDGSLDAGPDPRVDTAQCPDGRGSDLDPVAAQVQPRSALTCSQGMLSPSSAREASKAAMSSASSKASSSCSYRSMLTSTAAGRP